MLSHHGQIRTQFKISCMWIKLLTPSNFIAIYALCKSASWRMGHMICSTSYLLQYLVRILALGSIQLMFLELNSKWETNAVLQRDWEYACCFDYYISGWHLDIANTQFLVTIESLETHKTKCNSTMKGTVTYKINMTVQLWWDVIGPIIIMISTEINWFCTRLTAVLRQQLLFLV